MSVLTHPLDNIITNSQRPLPQGAGKDLASVALRMYRESGMGAFTRGLAIKVVDSSYHMAWMYGVGGIAYIRVRQAMEESKAVEDSGAIERRQQPLKKRTQDETKIRELE